MFVPLAPAAHPIRAPDEITDGPRLAGVNREGMPADRKLSFPGPLPFDARGPRRIYSVGRFFNTDGRWICMLYLCIGFLLFR